MKFYKSLIVVFLIILCSCGTDKTGGDFSKDGVSFTYPSGWNIEEQNDIDGAGYYLSVNKSGFNTSGVLTLTWIERKLDEDTYLEIIQEGFNEEEVLSDLEFQSAKEDDFNGIPALSCNYTFNTLGIEHQGIVYVFLKGERTYSVIEQEAVYDVSKNKEGFDTIESTFKLE